MSGYECERCGVAWPNDLPPCPNCGGSVASCDRPCPSCAEKDAEIERLKEARGTLIVERNDAQSRMKGAVSEWSRRVDSLRSLLAAAEKERDEARESLGICSHHQDILAEERDTLAARVTALEGALRLAEGQLDRDALLAGEGS